MEYRRYYLVIQVLRVAVIRSQYTEVNKVYKASRPGQCYTLYKSTAGPLTWTQARQSCISYNMTLATVPDVDTQTSLERLIETGCNTEAWTAGRVEDDNRWQRLNGQIYTETPKESSDINDNCGYLLVDTVTEFYSDSCTDFKYPLCYYSPKGSSCTDGDIHVGAACLRVVSPPVNWYSAVIACNNLGYGLSRYDSGLLQLNKTYLTERNIWLDVYRHQWRWNTGIDISTIEYFNWDPHFGINIPDHCIYISDNGAKWKSQRCDSTTEDVRYFICEKDTTIPTMYTASTAMATTWNNEGFNKQKITLPEYVIAIIVVGGLLLIFFIVVVVILYRRCTHTAPRQGRQVRRNIRASAIQRTSSEDIRQGVERSTRPERSLTSEVNSPSDAADGREVIEPPSDQQQERTKQLENNRKGQQRKDHDYEKPSIYVNIIERPTVYESLKK